MNRTADARLAGVGRRLDLLLNLTPVNAASAWTEFERSGFRETPLFEYRDLGFDPEELRRELRSLPLEEIEEHEIVQLVEAKVREIEAQIDLLEARDTPRFKEESIRLYGGVSDALLDGAQTILTELPEAPPETERVDASGMLRRAETELSHYRRRHAAFTQGVQIRPDVVDLMVSQGELLIGEASSFRRSRVEALIQHEIGTHVVTYFNALQQPFGLLALGLDGYEETQEGLAVMAEYAVGGLDAERMRILAARVLAVARTIEGAAFLEVFDELRAEHGLAPRNAWSVTARVARSGGLTKDAMYLRGLVAMLEHIAQGRALDPLLVGKIALVHVPLVRDLIERGVLYPPALLPLWLQGVHGERLRSLTPDTTAADLLEERIA